jgi:hypothetical protein
MRRLAIPILCCLLAVTLAACTPPVANAAGESGRIVVRFTDAVTDPADAGFVAGLARSAQCDLVYARPVSGGAHLYIAQNLSGPDALERVADRLRQRSDVIDAEPDRRFQPSRGTP